MAFEFRLFALPLIISGIASVMVAMLIQHRQNARGGSALTLPIPA